MTIHKLIRYNYIASAFLYQCTESYMNCLGLQGGGATALPLNPPLIRKLVL